MLLLVFAPAFAQVNVPERGEEREREAEVPLPEYPAATSLLVFPSTGAANTVLIDQKTLAIGDDGGVRFALVVRSPNGAESVSYEAIRCSDGTRRIYAFGRRSVDGGTWSPARNSAWRPISDGRINRHYFEFWRDVFCDGTRTEERAEILQNVRKGGRDRHFSLPSE